MKKRNTRRGFTRNCHPEFISGSTPLVTIQNKEEALNKSVFRAPLRSGFTLIELLVVVLIIGILAAVALPQYQKAVYKSRFATMKNLVKSIADAEEVFYLANGNYAATFEELDVSVPPAQDADNSTASNYAYDWGWCELKVSPGLIYCHNTPIGMEFQIYFSHAVGDFKGEHQCVAVGAQNLNTIQSQICQSESGQEGPSYSTENWTVWTY